jgi:glycosyltransferase involved in cell wall biosynthesis
VKPTVACFATQGLQSHDGRRIVELLEPLSPEAWEFDRSRKGRSMWRIVLRGLRQRPDVLVMEGTGIGGGLAVIGLRLLGGVRYVVSSGDAVGPFLARMHPAAAPIGWLYERLLCRLSSGYLAWTPYLAGRALAYRAPRAATVPGWAPVSAPVDRESARRRLGVPSECLVFGIVGSLDWNARVGYCYGLELLEALALVERTDIRVLVVGDGSGRSRLATRAEQLGARTILTGRVEPRDVPAHLAAMDVASLPQSVDRVGAYRYTIKLPEYLAAKLPVVTGQVPLAYDLDGGWLWRLPGEAPWDRRYIEALAALMRRLTHEEVARRRALVPRLAIFSRDEQQRRVVRFIEDVAAR